jgi:eukaryotic-like serine/threonine-protein kinase
VVLYEMLTGEPPYAADNPLATAMKHLDEPPRRPREANPAVPDGLDVLTAKLLAKDPGDRYASAAELAEDLRRVRDGLPPLAAGLGQATTARMPRDAGEGRTAPTLVAPEGRGKTSGTRRALLPMAALLLGLVALGGLAWALTRDTTGGGTPGASGAQRVEVPRVVGLPLEEARGRLGDRGLELGSQTEAASAEISAGAVAEQNPLAGTEAQRGTAVDLVVSTGPAPESTTPSSASSSATSSASASPTATAPASTPPVGGEAAKELREEQKEAEEAAKKAEKEAEEEAKERAKEQKEAKADKPTPGNKGKKDK